MFRIGGRRHRMSGTVKLGAQTEEETKSDENEHSLLFGREHNSAQAVRLAFSHAEEK